MKKIEVIKQNVEAAFQVADESTKKVLTALFGKEAVTPEAPDYSDWRNIKSYEDACAATNTPMIVDFEGNEPDEVAYCKLKVVSKALWGKDFEPKPDAEGKDIYWYPWFALYTKKEIANMDEDQKGALLSATANNGTGAGFGLLHTIIRSSTAYAHYGFRLCQETEEKARYFGRQFTKLWADYLLMNVEVKEIGVE